MVLQEQLMLTRRRCLLLRRWDLVLFSLFFFRAKNYYKVLWREIYGFLQIWMVVFAVIQAVLLYFVIPQEAERYKWWSIFFTNFSNVFFALQQSWVIYIMFLQ